MKLATRAYHLVDIENLLGLTHGQPVASDAGSFYRSVAGVQANDLMVVAADQSRAFDINIAFPGVRILHGTGPDGADNALITATDLDHLATRFTTIVIGSGDGRFLDVAYRARQHRLEVVVVSQRCALSRQLAKYADVIIDVPEMSGAVDLTTAA